MTSSRARLVLAIVLVLVFGSASPVSGDPGNDMAALARSVGENPTLFERLSPTRQAQLLEFVRSGTVIVNVVGEAPNPSSTATPAGVETMSSGWLCGDRTVEIYKQDGNGNIRWRVWQRIWWWCDGSTVTAHGPSWGGSADYGWYYKGVVDTSEQGGDGQSYYRLWKKHWACWSCDVWFADHDYPAIDMSVFGTGGISWSTSCDMC